jgi:hypothetical protein
MDTYPLHLINGFSVALQCRNYEAVNKVTDYHLSIYCFDVPKANKTSLQSLD